jgi:hypothetical protein
MCIRDRFQAVQDLLFCDRKKRGVTLHASAERDKPISQAIEVENLCKLLIREMCPHKMSMGDDFSFQEVAVSRKQDPSFSNGDFSNVRIMKTGPPDTIETRHT